MPMQMISWTKPDGSTPKEVIWKLKKAMCRAQQDAGRRYRDSDNKESWFIIHPKLTDPNPRTEK